MRSGWLVEGRVQGVGYRYFVRREAERLGLVGYARNLPDGRVEVVAEGDPADLARLESALSVGPRQAEVRDVLSWQISDDARQFKSFDTL